MGDHNWFLRINKINSEKKKGIIKKYPKDKHGNIIIKDGTYVISKLPTDFFNFTNGWIGRPQIEDFYREENPVKLFLVKSYIPDKCPGIYTGTDREILMANNFILTEIAKQFELETAEYYNVIFEDGEELKCDENYKKRDGVKTQKIQANTRYLLTPSFKKNNEKLIHFAEFLDSQYELNAEKIFRKLREFLKSENVVEDDIDAISRNYIKQCIFNKFIGFSDEHNYNAAILVTEEKNGKRARLAPCYDLDFATNVFNITEGEFPKIFSRYGKEKKHTLLDMLAQFYCAFERRYLGEIIPRIDINEAIKNGERNGNIKLSNMAKERYMQFFKEQQQELEDFYNRYCMKKLKKTIIREKKERGLQKKGEDVTK